MATRKTTTKSTTAKSTTAKTTRRRTTKKAAAPKVEPEVVEGARVEKGDMLGYFLFGGSDYVMLFQKEAGFDLTTPRIDRETFEHRLFGEEYGRFLP